MLSEPIILFVLAISGLCFGSFAGAQVWRIRAKQLADDKKAGEKIDEKEYKKLLELTKHKGAKDRSRCLHCDHVLAWYDLLPLVSWVSTGGKCRYCHKKIGLFEPTIEIAVGTAFVLSYLIWVPQLSGGIMIAQFVIWLVVIVLLAILAAYDLKWFLLPDRIVFPLIGVSVVYAVLGFVDMQNGVAGLINMMASITIMSGIYLVLWLVSKGKWIGFGDVKLGLALGILLGSWQLAFLALFLANLIGCLIVIPLLATKRMKRSTQVPFGPMLIAGFAIAMLCGSMIIDSYLSSASLLML